MRVHPSCVFGNAFASGKGHFATLLLHLSVLGVGGNAAFIGDIGDAA